MRCSPGDPLGPPQGPEGLCLAEWRRPRPHFRTGVPGTGGWLQANNSISLCLQPSRAGKNNTSILGWADIGSTDPRSTPKPPESLSYDSGYQLWVPRGSPRSCPRVLHGRRGIGGSESQQRGPEAGVPPSRIFSQTVLSRGPGAGTGRHVQPGQMETQPAPCQAQGARTSQEMGPCASLSVSQERAGHRNEPHPLPRGPEAPCKPSSPPGDMVPSQSPPGSARCGVVLMAAGRVEPRRSPSSGSPQGCAPQLSASTVWEQGQRKGGGGGLLHSGPHLFRLPLKRASCPKEGDPTLVAAFHLCQETGQEGGFRGRAGGPR